MKEDKKQIDPKILDEIIMAIGKTKFGEIVVTMHDGKVVQIERKEKKRFI